MRISQRIIQTAPQFQQPLHPTLATILAARGVVSDEQLQLSLQTLLPPASMLGLDQGVALLWQALQQQKHILIVADYDADGATSCALALLGLRAFGFQHVGYLVPNRFDYGYGLTPPIVELAKQQQPDLLITVDNGIASHAGVALARSYGIDVLITDHHLPATTLPDATAIMNPNQPGCAFASKALAGVGVVFYLLLGLRKELRERQWFTSTNRVEPNLAHWLDLVALGTVADVAALDENNRRLVKHGLHLIKQGRCRPGILALLELAGRNPTQCVANDLGFAVGPRLNAAGRLDDMGLGIECLLTDDPQRARQMAQQLDALNKDRRVIEQDMQDMALQQLAAMELPAEPRYSMCLYESTWHQGVIGILASRIKDRLHCPVIVFADAGNDEHGQPQLKGSARSIAGIHIRDMLDAVATRHPGILEKFGGHAMAAGLTIARVHFDEFAQALELAIQTVASPELFAKEVHYDGSLASECFSLDFATLLRNLTPWGQHFPEPLFHDEFLILNRRVLSEKHLKFTLQIPQSSRSIDAIAFNVAPAHLQSSAQRVCLLYKLDINEFRGDCTPQLMIEHLEYV
jgi:single-stranded-DNA-specific exonuclease